MAQPAVLAAQSTPAAAVPVTVPAGTTLLVRMMDGISSQNKPGSKFTTVLESDLSVDGAVVAKAGTKVYGELEAASRRAAPRDSRSSTSASNRSTSKGAWRPSRRRITK